MENYDLFGDDLGSGMLDALGDLGGDRGNINILSSQQNTGAGHMMQSYNNQQPQYTQIGQGMASSGKLSSGPYPDYMNQYATGAPTQPTMGGYPGSAPSRPMTGYPYPHQPSSSPSMHYQDYSVQSQPGMMRHPAPSPQHIPPPRMVTPVANQSQSQFVVGTYRPPSQDPMYLQQYSRWNEQTTTSASYGTSSLQHHYPAGSTAGYRPLAPPAPHGYASSIQRVPQPISHSNPPQTSQQSTQPPGASHPQHNIPYMTTRPQTPVLPQTSQAQYGQSMYPSANQYPNYHTSASVSQLGTPSAAPTYPHAPHPQQQYGLTTPSAQQHLYSSNQYGQYYPTGTSNVSMSSHTSQAATMAYPSSYQTQPAVPHIASSVANGAPTYRPGYTSVPVPQLSPRQPTPSPRQPTPSPKPPASTTPTIPTSSTPSTLPQQQQQQPQGSQVSQTGLHQQSTPSSLQQLEQMVMPHVNANNKNSPSPKPLHGNIQTVGGVMSPMSMGGPRTPMSPTMQGPKTPMSPNQWQSQGPRAPISSKPAYLHPPSQPQQAYPNSPNGHGIANSIPAVPNSDCNTGAGNSITHTGTEAELCGLNPTLDGAVTNQSTTLPSSSTTDDVKHSAGATQQPLTSGTSEGSIEGLKDEQSQISVLQSDDQKPALQISTSNSNITTAPETDAGTSRVVPICDISPTGSSHSSGTLQQPVEKAEVGDEGNKQQSVLASNSNPASSTAPIDSSTTGISSLDAQQQESSQPSYGAQYHSFNGANESSQPQSQVVSQLPPNQGQNPSQMVNNNNIGGYGPPQGHSQQQYGNAMEQSQPVGKPMLPAQGSHPHPYPPRFPNEGNTVQQPYMNSYHNSGMYPPAPYGQPMHPMGPPGPPQFMGPQGMQGPIPGGPDRLGFEMHQINQQLQHLYSIPPNPQTQIQISELQERLRSLQQQSHMMQGGQYPMQPPLGPVPPYGQMPPMMPPVDLEAQEKGRRKKGERKPKEPKEPKQRGRKSKKANLDESGGDSLIAPHDEFEFQDGPSDAVEPKGRKGRKPREPKSPKKPKEPKTPKEKTPKRGRKKKGAEEEEDSLNSSFPSAEGEGESSILEEHSEFEAGTLSGGAGIADADGSTLLIPDEGTQDVTTEGSDTPKKPKKPKVKSASTGKKRPSKTLLTFKGRKKRRRSDSEGSELERTPPPSPLPEDDLNKRRSGRNTQRKKYVDDIDLALSEEELLMPSKQAKATPDTAVPEGDAGNAVNGEAEPKPEVLSPVKKEKEKPMEEPPPSINKHNFFYVNPADEDTMVVQQILSMRMGSRELLDSSDDEDEDVTKVQKTEEATKDADTEKPEQDKDEPGKSENVEETKEVDSAKVPIESEDTKQHEAPEPTESINEPKPVPAEEVTETKEESDQKPVVDAPSIPEAKIERKHSIDAKKKEARVVEVEEFYVKYKNFSYLHCEWKTEEELLKGDKRVQAKIKRFKQKLNNANLYDFLEEEPFNPEYIEVDRVLDMSEVTDPSSGKMTKNYLVKWRALPYDEATWELEDDIDPEKISQFHRFSVVPDRNQWKPKKRPKVPDWVKLDASPMYKNGNRLRDYQLEGLNWLTFSWHNGRNCILADEMGLGKTIQSLAFIDSVFKYGIRGPFLVIAPLSTVPNWQREFETWTDLNVVVYHGSVASRNMIQEYEIFYRHPDNPQMNIKDCYKCHVMITTFEIVLTDVMELKDYPWRVVVIDEAHRLKNKNCKLLEGLRLLNMEHRVLLSGTPLQNNVQELFSLLNFLEPQQFSSDESFVKEFGDLKSETQVQKLQALLKPMMLRRLKEDVEKSIAPKEETIVEVELTNIQKKYYRAILERNFSFLAKGTSSSNVPNLMNTMMELRKCCIHPYLLNGAEEQIQLDYRLTHSIPESDPDVYYNALVQSSGKMVLVDKLLAKLKDGGHRVLIFSQMVRCLDILEDYLVYRQYPFERLDGRIRGPVRQAAIDRYSKPDSDRFVFLLCTKAGGLGINLTAADTVIIYDSDWNPQNDIQAQARCHRIGQSKKVKIYRLICRNTYEREMFDRASLKLGLDKAVLQSMNTSQGGKMDPSTGTTKQLTKKEVEDLLKRGAYGALMDEDNAGEKFCEEDIDVILERRTQVITLESGEKGSTFSKASFAASGIREDINIDDVDFWKKWAKKAEIDIDELVDKNNLVIHEPRRRTQIRRYGHDEGLMEMSDLDTSSDSDEEGNVGDRTRSGKGRKSRKSKRGRRGNLEDDYQLDDGIVEYGKWSKSECYKIERGLLTYGWKRWDKILEHGQFRLGWSTQHMEDCARLILLHCANNFRGDEKVKSFVADLICPNDTGNNITRNHSGLANPVSRGGRKSKKKDKATKPETPENDDWMKEERYDAELHLEPAFLKHLSKNSNKVLLRIRMLYYIQQEIIGMKTRQLDLGVPASDLDIVPSSMTVDNGPVAWWDKEADASLLAGTYKHGYERYNVMRQDQALCFLGRCGPPDGSAVLAEISADVNEEEMEKDVAGDEEDDESNLDAAEAVSSKEKSKDSPAQNTPAKADNEDDKSTDEGKTAAEATSTTDDNPNAEEKPIFPTTTDLNTRIRKLITAFQRHFKKEEVKNAQRAKRLERKEKIDQIVRERERQKLEVHQKRWSKKEEADFLRTVSTFGVQRVGKNKFDWSKFRAISRLDKKFDETLTEYFRAFYAMCKRICGQKLTEEEEFDLIQVPVEPLPEDRARRVLDRIDLLCKIREEILHHEELEERLKLCLPSLDMPEWWVPGKHDKDLLIAAARHGLGRTELFYINDPELSFCEILRRHMGGDPLVDPAEKAEPPPAKRARTDMVDIEIQDLKTGFDKKEVDEKNAGEKNDSGPKTNPEQKDTADPITNGDGPNTSVVKIEQPDVEESEKSSEAAGGEEVKMSEEPRNEKGDECVIKEEPKDIEKNADNKRKNEEDSTPECADLSSKQNNEEDAPEKNGPTEPENGLDLSKDINAEPTTQKMEGDIESDNVKNEQALDNKEDKEKNDPCSEMNEVQVEIKDELRVTIKVPAEKMNRVEVQVKGSPKYPVPEAPSLVTPIIEKEKEEEASKPMLPKVDPMGNKEGGNMDVLGSLLNQMNPIRWPRDKAIQIRLEHIVHAVVKNEWPVSKFFSSAGMAETFEYSPQGTPDTVQDTPTPSECSDLASTEDLFMSLSHSNQSSMSNSPIVSSTTITPLSNSQRRGRRRKIAIDVETERAKLQALLSQSLSTSNILSHVSTNNPRLSSALRRDRGRSTPTKGLAFDLEKELESRLSHVQIPQFGKASKFQQPPPPAHQHHSLSRTTASLLRDSHNQQQHRSRSPLTRRDSPSAFGSQSSSLDLSVKSTHGKDVTAAAMSALSSLSSVTVTPVTIPSPSTRSRDRTRDLVSSGLTISSTPMDLSGGISKRSREGQSMLDRAFGSQESPLRFASGAPKKTSKLENMLDKLKKRKLGDASDVSDSEPLPLEKDKKKRKLDEIVFGLSAAKGSSMFSPPTVPEKRSSSGMNLSNLSTSNQSHSGRNSSASPHVSGSRSATPSPAAFSSSKDAQALAQSLLSNPLFSALSMFNPKDFNIKDLKDFSRLAAAAAGTPTTSSATGAKKGPTGGTQNPEMPKCDLSRLAEMAVPKFDLFSQDAKVNKWLAEHANLTPERPPSPEYVDRRRRRPQPSPSPSPLDWTKINGDESIPVVHRVSGKKLTGPKAPNLKNLGQWLLENPSYDVDPQWGELMMKERGAGDTQKRAQGEKKKGPGRPSTLTTPPPTTSTPSTLSVPTSTSNSFSSLGAFASLPGLAGINPSLLASFGALDPKNPLFGALDPKNPLLMPFGGLGSLGNLGLGNLGSLGMSNLGLPNNLFGLGSPFMGFGQDLSGSPSGRDKGNAGKDNNGPQSSSGTSKTPTSSSGQSKKDDKSKKSNSQQDLLSSALPFMFPNPGLMYNPLGLGSFSLGSGMSSSPFGNLGQNAMLNGLGGDGASNKKPAAATTSKSNSNPLLAAGLAGLNIPSLSKKDMKDLAASTSQSSSKADKYKSVDRSSSSKEKPVVPMTQHPEGEDSDDESLKSLMGNHQDDLPEDDPTPENAERIILRESKELEREMAQQRVETRREKRLRDREERTTGDRHMQGEKRKERIPKEEEVPTRTTRRAAAAVTRLRIEDSLKGDEGSDEGEDFSTRE